VIPSSIIAALQSVVEKDATKAFLTVTCVNPHLLEMAKKKEQALPPQKFLQWAASAGNLFEQQFGANVQQLTVTDANKEHIQGLIQDFSKALVEPITATKDLDGSSLMNELARNGVEIREGSFEAHRSTAWRAFEAKKQPLRNPFVELDPEDLLTVRLYSMDAEELSVVCYTTVNEALRNSVSLDSNTKLRAESVVASWKFFISHLTNTVSQLKGAIGTFYRGQTYIPPDVGSLRPGNVVIWPSFTSCSSNKSVAREFGQEKLIYEVETTFEHGGSIHDYSFYQNEDEFLIPPFTSFRVDSVTPNFDGFEWYMRLTCLGVTPTPLLSHPVPPKKAPKKAGALQSTPVDTAVSIVDDTVGGTETNEAGAFEAAAGGNALYFLFNKNIPSKLGEKQNEKGQSLLFVAAETNGSEAIVKWLVDNDSDVNTKNLIDGKTPLHGAVGKQAIAATKILLQGGADEAVSFKDVGEETPGFLQQVKEELKESTTANKGTTKDQPEEEKEEEPKRTTKEEEVEEEKKEESQEVSSPSEPGYEGLGVIPVEILQKGNTVTMQYMLDLAQSPGVPSRRSKMLVLGPKGAGKTSLVDSLFPLTDWLESQGSVKRTRYWFELKGNVFRKYTRQEDFTPHRETVLERNQWEVVKLERDGFKILPKVKGAAATPDIEVYCPNSETQMRWISRLIRVCAGQGLEVRSASLKETDLHTPVTEATPLELSVMEVDENNIPLHGLHHLLSPRSVFVIVWNMSEGDDKCLLGLKHWFKQLARYLNPTFDSNDSPLAPVPTQRHQVFHSIFVVGTHLDRLQLNKDKKMDRALRFATLARECGVLEPIQCLEMSCSPTFEHLQEVNDALLITTLSHDYIGEMVPAKYASISRYLSTLRSDKRDPGAQSLPVIPFKQIEERFGNSGLVKRALLLLSDWGECLYFDSPPLLASVVVYDKLGFYRATISELQKRSNPTLPGARNDGIVEHRTLGPLWPGSQGILQLDEAIMAVLQNLGLSLLLGPIGIPFAERKSFLPLLAAPTLDASLLLRAWPSDHEGSPYQVERVLRFSVLPDEYFSRVLVLLGPRIIEDSDLGLLARRNEAIIQVRELGETRARIRMEGDSRIIITVRGPDDSSRTKVLSLMLKTLRDAADSGQTGEYLRASLDLLEVKTAKDVTKTVQGTNTGGLSREENARRQEIDKELEERQKTIQRQERELEVQAREIEELKRNLAAALRK